MCRTDDVASSATDMLQPFDGMVARSMDRCLRNARASGGTKDCDAATSLAATTRSPCRGGVIAAARNEKPGRSPRRARWRRRCPINVPVMRAIGGLIGTLQFGQMPRRTVHASLSGIAPDPREFEPGVGAAMELAAGAERFRIEQNDDGIAVSLDLATSDGSGFSIRALNG